MPIRASASSRIGAVLLLLGGLCAVLMALLPWGEHGIGIVAAMRFISGRDSNEREAVEQMNPYLDQPLVPVGIAILLVAICGITALAAGLVGLRGRVPGLTRLLAWLSAIPMLLIVPVGVVLSWGAALSIGGVGSVLLCLSPLIVLTGAVVETFTGQPDPSTPGRYEVPRPQPWSSTNDS